MFASKVHFVGSVLQDDEDDYLFSVCNLPLNWRKTLLMMILWYEKSRESFKKNEKKTKKFQNQSESGNSIHISSLLQTDLVSSWRHLSTIPRPLKNGSWNSTCSKYVCKNQSGDKKVRESVFSMKNILSNELVHR